MLILLRSLPEALLLVAGPDHHDYALGVKKYYEDIGLGTAVRFLGEVTAVEGAKLFAAADVFVLPSQSENFGNEST